MVVEFVDIDIIEFRFLEEDIVMDLISGYGYFEENVSVLKKEVLYFFNYFSVI